MKLVWMILLVALPSTVFAAGGTTQPSTTETTGSCKTGMVWDPDTKKCVAPTESFLEDDVLFDAVREYAYAGEIHAAQAILAEMQDQNEDRVLTYWGFTHRKSGNLELGMDFYRKALQQNPGNLLARSYMGQAFVEIGHTDAAQAQLSEIRARGGRQTWAEQSLAMALEAGRGFAY